MELSDAALLEYNRMGIIPGPGEGMEAFSLRARYCLNLKDEFPEELKECLQDSSSNQSATLIDGAVTVSQYGINPSWIPIFFSNYRLPFWQGGCAWIYQLSNETPTAAFIQLRRQFKRHRRYLQIYDREELITHELCHVGRMMFEEPKFEEILAYNTSKWSFRRWIGPLAQSSVESVIFVLLLFMIIVFDVFLISTGRHEAYVWALWLKAIPLLLIGLGLARVWKRRSLLKCCQTNLAELVGEENTDAVAYRLTDEEIVAFASMAPEAIKDAAHKKAKDELRWHVITLGF